MSREIKFRIWDNQKKEWLGASDKDVLTYYGFHLVGEVMTVQAPPQWALDPHCVVEQYTGLKDKNGTGIYEGDIVKQLMYVLDGKECTTTWVVKWNNDEFCYDMHRISGELYGDSMLSTCESEYCEVIGNVHESNMEELCPKE